MATPLASVPTQAAQKPQDPADQARQQKTSNKFDEKMAQKAQDTQSAQRAGEVQRTQSAEKVTGLQKVDEIDRAQKAQFKKVNPSVSADKVRDQKHASTAKGDADSPGMKIMSDALSNVEQGNQAMDKWMRKLLSSNGQFSQKELLGLQMGMYKYSMELDLTGKVVDKATSGLKDTLKTQV